MSLFVTRRVPRGMIRIKNIIKILYQHVMVPQIKRVNET